MNLPENTFKRRLKAGEQQIGLWVSIPDPAMVEAMAGAGYDWMLIDTEHTPVEVSTVLTLLQAAAPYPTSAIVRPVVNDTALIKRHLDQGAQTLLLPYIETRAEAEAAARAMSYPSAGVRGVAGIQRGSRFGRVPDYMDRAEDELCLLLQIETVKGLENLEEIAGVEGVDGIFIGPSDLAASMGHRGRPGHPEVRAAILEAISRLKAMGKPAGILTLDEDFARTCIEAGTLFTAVGVDTALLIREVDALARRFGASFARD